MEIFGLPGHVLVVHGAVVLTPLAVLATVVFAVLPRWRYLSRWPAAVLAVVAAGAVWAAKITGTQFREDRFSALPADSPLRAAIDEHQDYGDLLAYVVLGFLLLTLVGVATLAGPSGLVSGRGERAPVAGWVEVVVPVALVVVSVVTLVYVVLTGDAGARATWAPPSG